MVRRGEPGGDCPLGSDLQAPVLRWRTAGRSGPASKGVTNLGWELEGLGDGPALVCLKSACPSEYDSSEWCFTKETLMMANAHMEFFAEITHCGACIASASWNSRHAARGRLLASIQGGQDICVGRCGRCLGN